MDGSLRNLRSSFYGADKVFDKSPLRRNIKGNGGSLSAVASVVFFLTLLHLLSMSIVAFSLRRKKKANFWVSQLGRRVKGSRETVIPDPDYRIPIVLLGGY